MAEKEKDYLEIKVPKIKKPTQLIVPLLIIIVIALSFGLGMLYMQVQALQNGTAGPVTTQPKTLTEAFVAYAKQIGIKTDQFKSCFESQKYLGRVNSQTQEGSSLGVAATPTFFINGRMLAGAFPIAEFKNIIDKELDGTGSTDPTAYDQVLQQAANDQQKAFDPTVKQIDLGDSPVQGAANAKVTIVEFSDFQCPFCERAFPTINQLMNDYKGKIKLVYKHYPLTSIHPYAQPAALAAECAREQNKFWEFHDLLFQNQNTWVNLPQALAPTGTTGS